MNRQRRDMLRISTAFGLAFAAGVLKPSDVFAAEWNGKAFDAKTLDAALAGLTSDTPLPSANLAINAPDIAENGAVVPVTVTSSMAGTDFLAVLIEKNPNPMSAGFTIPEGTEPSVSLRVKMGGTSKVYALARTGKSWHVAVKEIKVTMGGCGG